LHPSRPLLFLGPLCISKPATTTVWHPPSFVLAPQDRLMGGGTGAAASGGGLWSDFHSIPLGPRVGLITVQQGQCSPVGGKGSWVGSNGGVSSNKPSTGWGPARPCFWTAAVFPWCRELGPCLAGCTWLTLAAEWLNGDGEISRTMLDGGGHGRVEHQASLWRSPKARCDWRGLSRRNRRRP